MERQRYNGRALAALFINIPGLPFGFVAFASMFLVGTLPSEYSMGDFNLGNTQRLHTFLERFSKSQASGE